MLNQSLYYTIQYFEPNTKSKSKSSSNHFPFVADVAKKLGSRRDIGMPVDATLILLFFSQCNMSLSLDVVLLALI